jgi:hypothetical protein
MIRLTVSVCRKLGRQHYASDGASVSIDFEAEASLLGDPAALRARIQAVQRTCRHLVDEELAAQADGDGLEPTPADMPAPPHLPRPAVPPAARNNNGGGYQGQGNGRGTGPQSQPQPRSGGGGGGGNQSRQGPPANGRQLLGWASKKTQEAGWNMTTSLSNWGSDEGVGTRITEWDAETVARAYAAGLDWLASPVPS